jgi:alanine dehydrogenase
VRIIDADEIRTRATPPRLIDALREAFRGACLVPPRQVARTATSDPERLFLSMPAFAADGAGSVKLVTVRPDNASAGLPSIQALVVAFDAHGTPVAVLDGTLLTRVRTAAASALASSYLSRADSANLVVAGTGALAPHMAAAHAAVRPLRRIHVWGRDRGKAQHTVRAIRTMVDGAIEVAVAAELRDVAAQADIISCATSSATPFLCGAWLRSGAFVDLVGGFTPQRREADDEVVRRSHLFVDTFEGTLAEAGDLLDPLARGVITRGQIEAELADLVCARHPGRRTPQEIITFKSVGTALEDLAAAQLLLRDTSGAR